VLVCAGVLNLATFTVVDVRHDEHQGHLPRFVPVKLEPKVESEVVKLYRQGKKAGQIKIILDNQAYNEGDEKLDALCASKKVVLFSYFWFHLN
jgi:hypothetical protein